MLRGMSPTTENIRFAASTIGVTLPESFDACVLFPFGVAVPVSNVVLHACVKIHLTMDVCARLTAVPVNGCADNNDNNDNNDNEDN